MKLLIRRVWPAATAVRAFELVAAEGGDLPPWSPGAHIELMLDMPGGPETVAYSLCGDPADTSIWRIGVQLEPQGCGRSAWIHATLAAGDVIESSLPLNNFTLVTPSTHTVLISGGIGLTPILAMAKHLQATGASYELHVAARSRDRVAFARDLQSHGPRVHLALSGEGQRLDLAAVLGPPQAGRYVYVCGPRRMIDGLRYAGRIAGWDAAQIRFESFGARAEAGDKPAQVELTFTGSTVPVPADTPILTALLDAGVFASYECRRGECGMCATNYTRGTP